MIPGYSDIDFASIALRSNDDWYHRNTDYLRQALYFVAAKNHIGVSKALHDFAAAESRRLRSKADIMERYGVKVAPSPSREQREVLWIAIEEGIAALAAQEKAGIDEDKALMAVEHNVQAQMSLWSMEETLA